MSQKLGIFFMERHAVLFYTKRIEIVST